MANFCEIRSDDFQEIKQKYEKSNSDVGNLQGKRRREKKKVRQKFSQEIRLKGKVFSSVEITRRICGRKFTKN